MPSIGDLANDIARAAYELRIPVAIGSVLVASGVGLLAWRLGWFRAARRHPLRTGIVLMIALLVVVPSAWYLGSPIFVRTSLVEPSPTGLVPAATPAGEADPDFQAPGDPAIPSIPSFPAPSAAPSAPPAPPTPTPSLAAPLPATLASGTFEGTDDFHFGRGTASLIEVEPGRYHLRFEDFSVRNGPDLYVYLSPDPDGYAADALELGRLKATDGAFGYDLPAGTDPSRFRSAVIWCKQFSHLFATATLEAAESASTKIGKSQGYTRYGRLRSIALANATDGSVART